MARPARRTIQANGYIKIGSRYEHRIVLYDTIGDGPHQCPECGIAINWNQPRGSEHNLEVDHIDWDRQNNHPDNLRPICRPCNMRNRKHLADYGWMLDPDRE